MNNLLRKVMDDNVPKFSKQVVDGTVKEVFESLPDYLDKVISSSIRSLHKDIPLEYLSYSYMTPEENFQRTFSGNSSKANFDLAHSDVYKVKYHFKYNGVEFDRTVLLPYASDGNIMTISGTRYSIVPIVSDTVISPARYQVFVRLLKDKLTFKEDSVNFVHNGESTEGLLVWVEIMKNNVKSGPMGKPVSCISLYLLGRYGFKGVVDKYFKLDVNGLMERDFRDDDVIITKEVTPKMREIYNVYESTGFKPAKVKTKDDYVTHGIKICVHKDVPETPFIKHFIFGLIYSLDVMPWEGDELLSLISASYSNKFSEAKKHAYLEDECFKWRVILGTIACKGEHSDKKITEDIKEHFKSIEYYVDDTIKIQLRETGIYVEDYFDLIYYILKMYSQWTLAFKSYNSNIKNRYLDVKYYICYEIILGFNKTILEINKRRQKAKDQNKYIREDEIKKMFDEHFKQSRIYTIVKANKTNLAVTGADYSGDMKYVKCTCLLGEQSMGDGVKKASDPRFPEHTREINGAQTWLGSILFLPKQTPTPVLRANVYLQYNVNTGRIIIPKYIEKSIEAIDHKLRGKTDELLSNELLFESEDRISD